MSDQYSSDDPGKKQAKQSVKKTYSLKVMVVVRLLAEITVLLGFICLAAGTLFVPALEQLLPVFKTMIWAAAALAAGLLPFYGFITWCVQADERGLTAVSLLKRRFAPWGALENICFKSTWNWRRYVVSFKGGELSLPIWLADLKELVKLVRDCMPDKGAHAAAAARLFKQDAFGMVMRFGRVAIGLLFAGVFWSFCFTVCSGKVAGTGDCGLVFACCLAVTAGVVWRSLVIVLMPRCLELTEAELVVRTLFFERRLSWEQIKALTPSYFLLPEGLMLKTSAGSFLLTNELQAIDELEEAIGSKLALTNP